MFWVFLRFALGGIHINWFRRNQTSCNTKNSGTLLALVSTPCGKQGIPVENVEGLKLMTVTLVITTS